MENADYCRGKATRCRRLASSFTAERDPTAARLRAMAAEFDAAAAAIEARTAAALSLDENGYLPSKTEGTDPH